MPNNNSSPPPTVTMETGPVICGRCRRTFAHLAIDLVAGVQQLRSAEILISRIEAVCMNCGWVFYWNIREKDLGKMAITYGEVLRSVRPGYTPE